MKRNVIMWEVLNNVVRDIRLCVVPRILLLHNLNMPLPSQVSIGQPSPASEDNASASSRGEVEGSSDNNNSPPTSVIHGNGNPEKVEWPSKGLQVVGNPALDWIRGSFNENGAQNRMRQQTRESLDEISLIRFWLTR